MPEYRCWMYWVQLFWAHKGQFQAVFWAYLSQMIYSIDSIPHPIDTQNMRFEVNIMVEDSLITASVLFRQV